MLPEIGTEAESPARVRFAVGSVAGKDVLGVDAEVEPKVVRGCSSVLPTTNLNGALSPPTAAGTGVDAKEKPFDFSSSFFSKPLSLLVTDDPKLKEGATATGAGTGVTPNEKTGALARFIAS